MGIMERWTARDLVLGSQLALVLTLALCLPLMPHFLFSTNMGGISNYGVHARTVVPYTAGITVSSLLLALAGRRLSRDGHRGLALICSTTGVLFAINVLSTYPYKLGPTWGLVHSVCAILLAVAELAGALAVARLVDDRTSYAALAVTVAAFLVMTLSFFGTLHVLFAAEVLTGCAFGFLLVHGVGWAEDTGPSFAWTGRASPLTRTRS